MQLLIYCCFFLIGGIYGHDVLSEFRPQIISHRGASGYVPEHSLQAYQLAINLLTDYIEPDLCLTKDGVFVAMHDVLLDSTTNVASFSQYEERKTTRILDGTNMTGYFVSDFLYSELQELRLNQRLPNRTTLYNGAFQIPSFASIIDLAQENNAATNRTIGIYAELKHPSYFKSLGFNMEDMLLSALTEAGFTVIGDNVPNDLRQVVPIVIQCFDSSSLIYLKTQCNLPLVYLVETQPLYYWTSENMQSIAEYAQGIGPNKDSFGSLPFQVARAAVDRIHATGMVLHPFTFRADSGVTSRFNGDFEAEEMYFYCCLGMDGHFTEFPDRSRGTIELMTSYGGPGRCSMNCASPTTL